jgi:exodeoxyribonuclease V beta subunit
VALTRAKSRCYLVWGRFNEAETSALAYLLHQPPSLELAKVVSATGKRFKGLTDEDLLRELKGPLDKGKGSIGLCEMPMELAEEYSPFLKKDITLDCRTFSGNIDRQWRISSFSSLVSGRPHSDEMPDRDALDASDGHDQEDVEKSDAKEPDSGIFAFPKGAKAGTFLHGLFEHLDFTQANKSTMNELVGNKLREYGFEVTWLETLYHMIGKVLTVPLDPDIRDLRLSRIRNENRLNELEFYFPLKSISPKKLKSIFAKHSGLQISEDFPGHIERLDFAPVRGFMKGFMDLVFQWRGRFYLVDWKSNFLGAQVEDYGQESLAFLMKKECYILQYCIYTLALDQYLSLRLPGYHYQKHFGGVLYIFLRGVEPEKGSDFGIYRDLPPPEFINELRKELISSRHFISPK